MIGKHSNDWVSVSEMDVPDLLLNNDDAYLDIEGIGRLWKQGDARNGRLLLAHGAGAGHETVFLRQLRESLAKNGVQTLAIEFEYMLRMHRENRRRPPPKPDRLVEEMVRWCDILTHSRLPELWLGGKSLGGRIASMVAAHDGAAGLALCGYPFHPPGKPEKTRLAHWPQITCPTLVLQGTRDPFGTREEVMGYDLPTHVQVAFLEDGDHDWKPRKATGLTQEKLIAEAASRIATAMSASR